MELSWLNPLLKNRTIDFICFGSSAREYAGGRFPTNPNGSFHDIAGICNAEGTVFGLMPHPERAFYWWQQADWTRREKIVEYGDGKLIFESLINHLKKG
jgi:phosphoribosylformylglycinamidine synthase